MVFAGLTLVFFLLNCFSCVCFCRISARALFASLTLVLYVQELLPSVRTLHAGSLQAKPASTGSWGLQPLMPEGFRYAPALRAYVYSLQRALDFIQAGGASGLELHVNLNDVQPDMEELLMAVAPVRSLRHRCAVRKARVPCGLLRRG